MERLNQILLLTLLLFITSHINTHAQGEVTLSGTTWTARVNNNTVYTGNDMMNAIQAAINNLTPNRTTKETVHVRNSGSTIPHVWDGDVKHINMHNYTILDFHGNTIHVNDNADNTTVPIRTREADWIEVRNMTITGNPRYGMWFFGCRNVILSQISLSIEATKSSNGPGLGVRFEARGGQISGRWNENVSIDHIFVEGSKAHAVEFWGTDGIDIGVVETRNTGGAGLLLNNNTNAYVRKVDAYRANYGGGYAGFRTANNCGPNIQVDTVISRECGRGVFGVSQSRGVTINWVEIEGCSGSGIFIEDSWDYTIKGGTVKNNGGEGVRLASRTNEHQPAQNVTIQNLCITGNHSYGIYETSSGSGFGNTNNNFFLNNDLRGSASNPSRELVYQGANTTASGNCLTNVPGNETTCGCTALEPTDCNGVAGGNAYLDNCEVCVGGNTGKSPCTTIENGFYSISPFHSGMCLIPGTNITQVTCEETPAQVWEITQSGNNYYIYSVEEQQYLSYGNGAQSNALTLSDNPSAFRIEEAQNETFHLVVANNSNLLADVEGNSSVEGQAVLLWIRNNQNNQRFTFGATSTDCQGTPFGEATIDACGTCVNGNTGKTACVEYLDGPEACVYQGTIENNHTGFHGIGFLNGDNAIDNTILWSLSAAQSGDYVIGFRYANGATTDRGMALKVNGIVQESNVAFAPTGAWNIWETQSVTLSMNEGPNTLELVANVAEGGPNFDLIALYQTEITSNTCEVDCNEEIGGTAFVDACNVCAGGNTGLVPTTDEEECTITQLADDALESTILCYPNPVSDVFHIEAKGNFDYRLYSITGNLIESGNGVDRLTIHKVLPQGIYLIDINSEAKQQVVRLIKN